MKTVAFVDQYGVSIGGGQRVLLETMWAAQKADFQVRLFAPRGGELERLVRFRFQDSVEFFDLPELHLGSGRKGVVDVLQVALTPLWLLKHASALMSSSLVYINGPRWLAAWMSLNLFLRKPTIVHLHLVYQGIEGELLRFCARRLGFHFVSASPFVADAAGFETRLVSNALDSQLSGVEFFWQKGPVRVGVVGRLSSEKGQHLVVALAKQNPEISFHFFGDHDFSSDSYSQGLRAQAGSNVFFHGKVSDIGVQFRKEGINTAIVPSVWHEPFGLVAIESMALSCLTLVRARGGLKQIADQTDAMTFGEDSDLREQFRKILEMSEGERQSLARKQYDLTQKNYSSDRYQDEIAKLIKELAEK